MAQTEPQGIESIPVPESGYWDGVLDSTPELAEKAHQAMMKQFEKGQRMKEILGRLASRGLMKPVRF